MTSSHWRADMFIGTIILTALFIPMMCSAVITGSHLDGSYFGSGEINGLGRRESDNSKSSQSSRHRMRRAVSQSDCDAYVSDKRLFRESTYLDLPMIGSNRDARIKKLTEIHIRHNLKGNVELRDSPDGFFRVQIRKSSGVEEEMSRITQEYRLEDTPGGKMIYIQVDYDENTTSLGTIIGGVAAVLILFSLIILVIWIYHKRHMEETPPGSGTPASRARQPGSMATQGSGSPSRKAHSRTASPNPRRSGLDSTSSHQRGRGSCERSKSSESVQPLPLPPPPRANPASRAGEQQRERQGSGSSHGTYRGTMVTFTVLSLVTVVCGALCQLEPRADVIVHIPENFDFGSVNVFFAKRNKGQLNMESWSQRDDQYKKVLIFDMDSARPSNNSVCTTEDRCPTAHHQGLAGCDIAGQECVCARGYRLSNGACHDIDECSEDRDACPAGVTCTDELGSHLCNCPLGYFYNLGDCQRCSAACPEGQFEVKQCSAQHDRICKPCSSCGPAMYSIQPCGGVWDNQCIHAAHPVLMTQEETFPFMIQDIQRHLYIDKRRKRRLHSNWSENVVVEDLHNTRDLEETFYATAGSEQKYDFWWVRDSKIKVNVGVEKVNIFPKFSDVDHPNSDNQFMLGPINGNTHIDSEWFRKITRSYCRYPVPEFYKVILQIGRDRMTNATEKQCRLDDYHCLERVTDFQHNSYVERTVNDACKRRYREQGVFPEQLKEASNTFVCVDGAKDLLNLFGLDEKPVTPLRHSPRTCMEAYSQCESCVRTNCGVGGDPFTKSCCQTSCFSGSASTDICGPSFKSACQNSKIECAQGDAYSFILEPRFHTAARNQNSSFQCHLRHYKPDLLYKVWFYVSIPKIQFDLPRISREVYASDVADVSHGTYQMEFIDLEHDTLVDLDDEMMLVGALNEKNEPEQFTMYPLKKPEDYEHMGFVVEPIIDTQSYNTAVQFNEIFGLSTTSWRNSHCDKDTSKFTSVQTHYKNNPQRVKITAETVRAPYKYYIKHANEKNPTIKFSTPANSSVLRWYFESQPSSLILDESLQLELHLLNDVRLWNISLKGVMTECPGFLAVTINDRVEDAELFKYDAIVQCDEKGDATFNATFKIPHFGSGLDKTFEVLLDDAKKEYRMFLTHINLDNEVRNNVAEVTVTFDESQGGLPMLMICIVSVAIVLMVCVSVCLYLAIEEKKDPGHMQEDRHYYDTLVEPGIAARTSSKHKHQQGNNCCTALRHMTTSRMMIVILYITFKVIYSFAFTFSVFFTVLILFVQGHLETITQVDMVQLQHHNQSIVIQKQVEIHVQREVERQARQARDTQNACYGYLDQVTEMFADDVDNFTDPETLQDFFLNGPSISSVFQQKFQEFISAYDEKLDQYELEYETFFNRSMSYYFKRYVAYLDLAFYKNPWLSQWAHSFNLTKDPQFFQYATDEPTDSPITGNAVDFAEFAHINEVLDVKLWPIRFWERFYTMPDMPVLDRDMFLESQCAPTSLKNVTSDAVGHTDSVYFIYPEMGEPEAFIGATMDSVFSVQDFLEELNLGVLRLVFFSMDILIIFYRITHLYLAVRSLCLGFIEHIHLNAEDIKENGKGIIHRRLDNTGKYYTEQYIPLRPTYDTPRDPDDMTQVSDQDTLSSIIPPSTTTTMTTTSQPHSTTHSKHKTNGDVVHSPPTNGNPTSTTSTIVKNTKDNSKIYHRKVALSNGIHRIKTSLKILLEGTLLPKFVLGTALLLLVSMTINFAQTVLTVDTIISLACFVPNLPGVRWHIDSTNDYLTTMANQLFSTSFNWYGDHMESELKYMKSFHDFFNQEQERRTANYVTEGCTVQGILYSNGSCHIHREPPRLDIPMMPCNFVPIQPFLYTDHNLTILEDSIGEHYSPIILSAQSILLHSIYGALIMAAIMLIGHAVGVLLMYYFKVRGIFKTREVYVVPTSVDLVSLYGARPAILGQYAPDTAVGQYDTSFETEELDIDDTHDSTLNTNDVPSPPPQPLYSTVQRFDPAQHARTVQFRDVPSFDDPDGGSKTLPVQTSSPRVVPKTISQTVKPMKLSKRSRPQALTDMGYSETKV